MRRNATIFCKYGDLAGYYWIEERGRELHLHGIVILKEFRGTGIGTRVLQKLADEFAGEADFIGLGVHHANLGAKKLYQRMGFEPVKSLPDLEFDIMRRPLAPAEWE